MYAYQGNHLSGFVEQPVGDLLIESVKVVEVDIAVVFFEKGILAELVTVNARQLQDQIPRLW